jgi:hypothetical protein
MMDVAEANDIGMIGMKPYGGVAETAEEVASRVRSTSNGMPGKW